MSLLDHLIHDPPSEEIAARLEAAGATCCEHHKMFVLREVSP